MYNDDGKPVFVRPSGCAQKGHCTDVSRHHRNTDNPPRNCAVPLVKIFGSFHFAADDVAHRQKNGEKSNDNAPIE